MSRNAAGLLLVNGGTVLISGGVPTIANTTQIKMFGLAGNDILLVDDSNGRCRPLS